MVPVQVGHGGVDAAGGQGNAHEDHAKVGILAASLLAPSWPPSAETRKRQDRAVEADVVIYSNRDGISEVYDDDRRPRT